LSHFRVKWVRPGDGPVLQRLSGFLATYALVLFFGGTISGVAGQLTFDTIGAWTVQIDRGDPTAQPLEGTTRIPDYYSGSVRRVGGSPSGPDTGLIWVGCSGASREVTRVYFGAGFDTFPSDVERVSVQMWFDSPPAGPPTQWIRESMGQGALRDSGRHGPDPPHELAAILRQLFAHDSVHFSGPITSGEEGKTFSFSLRGLGEAWEAAGCRSG
jgi:hypothetical protein